MPTVQKKIAAPVLVIISAIGLLSFAAACKKRPPSHEILSAQIQENLRSRLDKAEIPPEVCVGDDLIQASTLVREFYQGRQYQPAWSRQGSLLAHVESLLFAIRAAEQEGLFPWDYHLHSILAKGKEFVRISAGDPRQLAPVLSDLELLLTDAFLVYATHLAQGKVNRDTFEAEWDADCRSMDVLDLLQTSLASGRVWENLRNLPPQHAYYADLKKALMSYRKLASKNDWPRVPGDPPLQKGDRGNRVEALRSRLLREGFDGRLQSKPKDLFDENTERAVCRFQDKHGLPQTGVVDEATFKALAVSAAERMRQIEVNLERWRWLPHDLGPTYAVVDAAGFEMFVVDRGQEVMAMKIVAGMNAWPTPVFSSRMTDIVINPYWYAPTQVLLKELINYIKADPNYLTSNKMKLLHGWGKEETEVDVKTLDLDAVNAKNLDFYLRQDPGPLNVLGRIKFSMPNTYDVYLHDTPYQSDFGQFTRTFSHGCIRIAKPVDFALFLLQETERWDEEKIAACIDQEVEQTIPVKRRLNVHVFYGTAWPLEDGSVQFRQDIYEQDNRVAEALHQNPPKVHKIAAPSLNGKQPIKKEANAQSDEKKRDDR